MSPVVPLIGLRRYQPAGPFVATVDHVGLWQLPGLLGNLPLVGTYGASHAECCTNKPDHVGTYLNIFYNWSQQKLSYKGVGEFLADSLGPGGAYTGKRVCLLEDSTGRSQ